MSFDSHANFSYSTVASAPSPASSGTSLIVQTGDGSKFPTAPFNATVWPAGSQPTTVNAEIVRVTNVATDTLTITRAQESTSARSILVGDQIAATITKKTLTDVEGSVNPSVVVVAAPTGTAATDNAAIAAAVTACPTGGTVQLQAGTYAIIDAVTTSSIAIAKKITLRGQGGADALWTTYGTRLTVDHATADAISISAHGVHIENLAIQNTHATAPTAGAGVKTVTGGGNSTHYGPDLSVRGFYYCVDHQAGGEWLMDPSCFIYDFVYAGLRIQNVDNVDSGDAFVSGEFVAGPTNNSNSCIKWLSGGGTKIIGAKLNTRSGKTCTVGIDMELQDGVSTSDFIVSACSIENCNWGFLCEHAGPSNTGMFTNIVIVGNQFNPIGGLNTGVVAISPAATGKVSAVNVGGNVIVSSSASQWGTYFAKVNNATHGPNVYVTNAGYTDGGGNTNITSVGAG